MLVRSRWLRHFIASAACRKEVGPSRRPDGQVYEITWKPESAARYHWEVLNKSSSNTSQDLYCSSPSALFRSKFRNFWFATAEVTERELEQLERQRFGSYSRHAREHFRKSEGGP